MKETKTVDSVTVQEGAPVAGEPVPAGAGTSQRSDFHSRDTESQA